MKPGSITEALADWGASSSWRQLAQTEQESVLDSIVDTVGVALAGFDEPVARIARDYVVETSAVGTAEIWGWQRSLEAASAAFANGVAAHALDFDDMHYKIYGHPSCSLVPALFALAQQEGLAGAELVDGYVAGIGCMAALSHLYGVGHYASGWHATSTLGTVGSAVALARMLAMPPAQVAKVIGIATSFASGSRANFGTMTKSIHAGMAARSAVDAVQLVRKGTTSNATAIEWPTGAIAMFGDGSTDVTQFAAADRERMLAHAECAIRDKGIKKYPSCGGTHFGIDAALELRKRIPSPEAIARITVRIPAGGLTALDYDDPETGLQAKFSLPYTVAVTLAHGLPTISAFSDDRVADPQTRQLMAMLDVVEESRSVSTGGTSAAFAEVAAELTDGSALRARVVDHRGTPSSPLTRAEVDEKFLMCSAGVVGAEVASSILLRLRELPSGGQVEPLFGGGLKGACHGQEVRRVKAG